MISVLLPTYNSAATIKAAINSMLRQTYGEFELLVLDDGSTDNTKDVVQSLSDSRIRLIQLPHQGLTATLNYGLSAAKYDIVARMDADDLSAPARFERQLTFLSRLPERFIISCWYGIFVNTSIQYIIRTPISSAEIKKGLLLYSYLSHPGLMCRKNTLLSNGGYLHTGENDAFEDYATWLNIKDSVEFAIIPEVLIFQRYRKHSLSNDISYQQKIMYYIQQQYYHDLRRHFGIDDMKEEYYYRGWREYFYGNQAMARKYWKHLGWNVLKYTRVWAAWIMTYLPPGIVIRFKELRVKFRLQYLLHYYSSTATQARRTFHSLLCNEIT
jgi:glycosyltransferase involved in cell wall biosynthesis